MAGEGLLLGFGCLLYERDLSLNTVEECADSHADFRAEFGWKSEAGLRLKTRGRSFSPNRGRGAWAGVSLDARHTFTPGFTFDAAFAAAGAALLSGAGPILRPGFNLPFAAWDRRTAGAGSSGMRGSWRPFGDCRLRRGIRFGGLRWAKLGPFRRRCRNLLVRLPHFRLCLFRDHLWPDRWRWRFLPSNETVSLLGRSLGFLCTAEAGCQAFNCCGRPLLAWRLGGASALAGGGSLRTADGPLLRWQVTHNA